MNGTRWSTTSTWKDIAKQLQAAGAGYYLITIGQNSGYYLAPNATYDKFVGIKPSKLSRRDLVSDLSAALSKRGIKLMVYLPSGAPGGDTVANTALQWRNGPYPNREFQLKWEQVIRDWSKRWGDEGLRVVVRWLLLRELDVPFSAELPTSPASRRRPARATRTARLAFNPGVVFASSP